MSEDTIERLSDALIETINDFAETSRLTTGDAMGALFSVMISSAKASPQYDPKRLVIEVNEKIKDAVGLQ
jgi:hypothetical protein